MPNLPRTARILAERRSLARAASTIRGLAQRFAGELDIFLRAGVAGLATEDLLALGDGFGGAAGEKQGVAEIGTRGEAVGC
jgi:hypothetical protein